MGNWHLTETDKHTHTQFNKKEKKKRTGKCYVQCRESGNRRANVQQPIGE